MNLPFKIDPTVDTSTFDQNYPGSGGVHPAHPDRNKDSLKHDVVSHGHTWAFAVAATVKAQIHALEQFTPELITMREGAPCSFQLDWGVAKYTKIPGLRLIMLMSLYAAPPNNEFKLQARNKRLSEIGFWAPDNFFFKMRDRLCTPESLLVVRQTQLAMAYTLHLALKESFLYQQTHKQNIAPEKLLILAFPFLVQGIYYNFTLEDALLGEMPWSASNGNTKVSPLHWLSSLSLAEALIGRITREKLNSDQRSLYDFCKEMLEVGPMSKRRKPVHTSSPNPYVSDLADGISGALPGGGSW